MEHGLQLKILIIATTARVASQKNHITTARVLNTTEDTSYMPRTKQVYRRVGGAKIDALRK
jgi:hypothetical protein